ncbi:MAG: hypothetical protein PUI24_06560 [Spirochaetales bacterium]|nr:hypothetical protein [Spirochaetales bacterium]
MKKSILALAVTVLAGAFFVSCSTSESSTAMVRDSLVLTAIPFELEGETSVDNFKLHWNEVNWKSENESSKSSYFILYENQNGKWVYAEEKSTRRKMKGTTYDVYDLGTNSRTYKVEAYNSSGSLIAVSNSYTCKPFTDETTDIFDNTKQSLVNKPNDEIFFNGKYWRYIYNRTADNAVSYEEQYSETGLPDDLWESNGIVISGNPADFEDGKNDPRYCEYLSAEYNDGNGCKLESTSWQVKGSNVISWSHYENGINYSLSQVICIYGTPGTGLFQARSAPYQPQGNASRDLISFVDSDGKCYILGSTSTQRCYRLKDNWLDIDDSFEGVITSTASREAPCIRKVDGWYYLFSSESAGWYPTQGTYQSASSLLELKDATMNPMGNRATFGAQSGQIDKMGNSYYMLANRWSQGWNLGGTPEYTETLGTSGIRFAQRMLPISFKGGYAFYDYFPQVKYNYSNGQVIGVQKGKLLSLNCLTNATDAAAGHPSSYAVDGISYAENPESPSWSSANYYCPAEKDEAEGVPYELVVILDKPALIKQVDVTFRNVNGSEPASGYLIEGSNNKDYTTLADRSTNYIIGFNENILPNSEQKYKFIKISVNSMRDVTHNTTRWWARGIHEVSIYGYDD